jgi:hypothetical protein
MSRPLDSGPPWLSSATAASWWACRWSGTPQTRVWCEPEVASRRFHSTGPCRPYQMAPTSLTTWLGPSSKRSPSTWRPKWLPCSKAPLSLQLGTCMPNARIGSPRFSGPSRGWQASVSATLSRLGPSTTPSSNTEMPLRWGGSWPTERGCSRPMDRSARPWPVRSISQTPATTGCSRWPSRCTDRCPASAEQDRSTAGGREPLPSHLS